jgi:hypothetical protein
VLAVFPTPDGWEKRDDPGPGTLLRLNGRGDETKSAARVGRPSGSGPTSKDALRGLKSAPEGGAERGNPARALLDGSRRHGDMAGADAAI